jgi:hypothetical protein
MLPNMQRGKDSLVLGREGGQGRLHGALAEGGPDGGGGQAAEAYRLAF